jgi:hypothetical protein
MRRYGNFVRTPQMDGGDKFGGGRTSSNSQVIAVHVSFGASRLEAGHRFETSGRFFEGSWSHVLRAPSGRDSIAGGTPADRVGIGGRVLGRCNLGHVPAANLGLSCGTLLSGRVYSAESIRQSLFGRVYSVTRSRGPACSNGVSQTEHSLAAPAEPRLLALGRRPVQRRRCGDDNVRQVENVGVVYCLTVVSSDNAD